MRPCEYCGDMLHNGECPRVSAREYFPDGSTRRVEFHDEKERHVPLGTQWIMTEGGWRSLPAAADEMPPLCTPLCLVVEAAKRRGY
jgi:hypothetical protein